MTKDSQYLKLMDEFQTVITANGYGSQPIFEALVSHVLVMAMKGTNFQMDAALQLISETINTLSPVIKHRVEHLQSPPWDETL